MKKIILITCITLLFSSIIGCEDNQYVTYTLATPVIMPLDEFRNSVVITSPKEIGNYPVVFTLGISTILLMASKTGCPFLIAVSTMERSMANSC